MASAIEYGEDKGIPTRIGTPADFAVFGPNGHKVFAYYSTNRDEIVINGDHHSWGSPDAYFATDHKNWFSSRNAQHAIHHEVGHALHARSLGRSAFVDLAERFDNMPDLLTARKVSSYASTNRQEFVAETYAALVAGRPLDDDVKRLYDRLGGPAVR
jgi:hypothetical protein